MSDVYGSSEVAEDLIKEVMDSSFISSKTKLDYAEQLVPLQQGDKAYETATRTQDIAQAERLSEYRYRFATMTGVMLGVMTFLMSTFMVLQERVVRGMADPVFTFLVPTILAMATIFSSWLIVRTLRYRKEATKDYKKARTQTLAADKADSQEEPKLRSEGVN